jgi:hypothetical protein
VKSLDIGQNLLVVFGTEQQDDPLSCFFNRGDWPMKLVKTSEIAQQVSRELCKIDATNGQRADWARGVHGRRLQEWVDNGGHVKPSKSMPISPRLQLDRSLERKQR